MFVINSSVTEELQKSRIEETDAKERKKKRKKKRNKRKKDLNEDLWR